MTVDDLIQALQQIPNEHRKYGVVFRKLHEIDGELSALHDTPIVGYWCDCDTEELCFLDSENMDRVERNMETEG